MAEVKVTTHSIKSSKSDSKAGHLFPSSAFNKTSSAELLSCYSWRLFPDR